MLNFLNWYSSVFWHIFFFTADNITSQSQACWLVNLLTKDTSSNKRSVFINIHRFSSSSSSCLMLILCIQLKDFPLPHFYATYECCIQRNLLELCSFNIFAPPPPPSSLIRILAFGGINLASLMSSDLNISIALIVVSSFTRTVSLKKLNWLQKYYKCISPPFLKPGFITIRFCCCH